MVERVCQSCGMPMGIGSEMYGTERDGSKSRDYCETCYEKGAFIEEISLDDMIESLVKIVLAGTDFVGEDGVRKMLREMLPTLKRWQA